MLQSYPKRASHWEGLLQTLLLMTLLTIAWFYSTATKIAADPDVAERLEIMMQALKVVAVAFLLVLATTALRKFMTNPPLVLIWGALLITSAVSWLLGCLIFLTAV